LIHKCEFIFFEGEDQAINVKLVFKETKFTMCGPPKITSEATLLSFSISQKDLLDMRKKGKEMENQNIIFANAIEFNMGKLIKIFNEMERAKASYTLNSGDAVPFQKGNQNDLGEASHIRKLDTKI